MAGQQTALQNPRGDMRWAITVLALLALIVPGKIWWHRTTAPLPFDPVQWKTAGPQARYRMTEDLLARYQAGELRTRDEVDRLLGPDDAERDDPYSRSFGLRPWDRNLHYLRVTFDERGQTVQLVLATH